MSRLSIYRCDIPWVDQFQLTTLRFTFCVLRSYLKSLDDSTTVHVLYVTVKRSKTQSSEISEQVKLWYMYSSDSPRVVRETHWFFNYNYLFLSLHLRDHLIKKTNVNSGAWGKMGTWDKTRKCDCFDFLFLSQHGKKL